MKQKFTAEELAEMAAADAEIEAEFRLTLEDLEQSSELDREAKFSSLSPEKRKVAEYQKAYYEANREKRRAYMREYMRKRRGQGGVRCGAQREPGREAADPMPPLCGEAGAGL